MAWGEGRLVADAAGADQGLVHHAGHGVGVERLLEHGVDAIRGHEVDAGRPRGCGQQQHRELGPAGAALERPGQAEAVELVAGHGDDHVDVVHTQQRHGLDQAGRVHHLGPDRLEGGGDEGDGVGVGFDHQHPVRIVGRGARSPAEPGRARWWGA
jgi:hypothetical protein